MPDIQFGEKTITVINKLLSDGINNISVLMRHSSRHYDTDPEKEPFMTLDEAGKKLSYQFGTKLPLDMSVHFFSSNIGRCIETAYLIDKGFIQNGGKTKNNIVENLLFPFYVGSPRDAFNIFINSGFETFFRKWFNGEISEKILADGKKSASLIVDFMKEKLMQNNRNEKNINISISHDWNLHLVKEFFLNLRHEDYGKVEYLEGVILYEKNSSFFLTNHQREPVLLNL